jgi:hypothetical protein
MQVSGAVVAFAILAAVIVCGGGLLAYLLRTVRLERTTPPVVDVERVHEHRVGPEAQDREGRFEKRPEHVAVEDPSHVVYIGVPD